MASSPLVILVTGANRGIGFSIVQATALRNPNAIYILACRSQASGTKAVDELKNLGVTAGFDVVELDITNDGSVIKAAEYVKEKYGHLDVLVNNAGIALHPSDPSHAAMRDTFATTFNANVASIYTTTTIFLPLLHASQRQPKVINVSSARASLTRSANGNLPPTLALAYGVSKTALNALTVEMQRAEDVAAAADAGEANAGSQSRRGESVRFWVVNPGHCKTAFNGFRGAKDPLDGAEVVVQLIVGEKGKWKSGAFWEFEGGVMGEVPW